MKRFEIITPADQPHASKLLAQPFHTALAGGVDLIDLLKQGVVGPRTLVNLKGLDGMDAITADGHGLRIGALVKLHAIATHPVIRERYTALADAADQAATPQIRNLATAGGNLLQRPRCWYFRNPEIYCLKKGGDRCYAQDGLNRYHAILGGGPSYIVHPSNLAPALITLDASVTLAGPAGQRHVALADFFTLPKADVTRENVLQPGEVLTEITLPSPSTDRRSVYLEAREKQSFDWPLVSVASALSMNGSVVRQARVVMGAVAPIPWRSPEAEKALAGASLTRDAATHAAELALKPARPLRENGYKVAIAKALIRRAILRAGGIEDSA